METYTLGQVIAERTYSYSPVVGIKENVVVRLGSPQATPNETDFFCAFEIADSGTRRIMRGFGVDALQALQLTLYLMGEMLHLYRRERGRSFCLAEPGDDLGFPRSRPTYCE